MRSGAAAFLPNKYLLIDNFSCKFLFVCPEMVTQARNVSDCLKPGHGAVRSAAAAFLPRNIWPKASKATAVLKLPGNQQDLTESSISWQKTQLGKIGENC